MEVQKCKANQHYNVTTYEYENIMKQEYKIKREVKKLIAVELQQKSRSKSKFFKMPGMQNHYISHRHYFSKNIIVSSQLHMLKH